MSQRVSGVVKFFSIDKGYGFIIPDNAENDVFVHLSDLPAGISKLEQDQRVSYIIVDSEKKKGNGKKATDLRLES